MCEWTVRYCGGTCAKRRQTLAIVEASVRWNCGASCPVGRSLHAELPPTTSLLCEGCRALQYHGIILRSNAGPPAGTVTATVTTSVTATWGATGTGMVSGMASPGVVAQTGRLKMEVDSA